jgi:hypothetical protein
MKTLSILSLLFVLLSPAGHAQHRTEDFRILLPQQKVAASLYRNISCIDSRYDSSNMGIVQLGAFNKKARVVPETPINEQLIAVMKALTDSTAQDGELIFHLRQLSFAEITGSFSEKGYCYLRAALYAKTQDGYRRLRTIDTVVLIKSMDVTRAMFRNGSKVITDFIASGLPEQPSGTVYTASNIGQMDSIEKRQLPLYNTAIFPDGIYYSYTSFLQQTPDKPVHTEPGNEKFTSFKTLDENGKSVKLKAKNVYAVTCNGKPYISIGNEFAPLRKTGDDFFFSGVGKTNPNTAEVVTAGIFFGVIGSLIASHAEAIFEMKLDHINGGFIRIREIKPGEDLAVLR